MTHTDLGIDLNTFAASLRVIGHPWRPGQPCKMGHVACTHGDLRRHMPHDIPIPGVTDELLMRMLREMQKRIPDFLLTVHFCILRGNNLDAAIIRATAALDKENQ
jgi:hypothetical protein